MPATPAALAYGRSICQTTFSDSTSPRTWSPRMTGRNTAPATAPAGAFQASMATFTQTGIGMVRTRPCLPYRSTMHHRPSRCCTCAMVSAATSDRRRAHPRSTAMMARSRSPFVVVISGAFSSAWACLRESQFPARTPMDLALFTTLDSGGQFRRQQAVVGRLHRQLPDRRHADNDAGRTQAAFLQGYAPGAHGGLGEAGPRLLGVPAEELVQGHVVHPLRDRRRNRIEHKALHPPPLVRFVHYG